MAFGNGLKGCFEIGIGLDIVKLGRGDQGRNNSPGFAAFIMTGEQGILPVQGHRSYRPFCGIVADLASAVIGIASQSVPPGQGYKIKGVLDCEQVRELARINGELGRLGGLLKLWLTDDARTAQFGRSTILAVLNKIEATQEEMGKVMTKVVMPRSEP